MLKLLKKIFKPEIIKAPVVTINGDEVKTYDSVEEAAKEMESKTINSEDRTGRGKQSLDVDNIGNNIK